MARWHSCNILHTAPDANRLWQFDAKSGALSREASSVPGEALSAKHVAKSWNSLWQPKLNVAWLPPENVFLRVVELPRSSFGETLSMVELQLEKLSPLPVAQIAWTLQILPQAPADNLQTVIVVMIERTLVEDFLGKLEAQGFLADRLEVPMLDQLAAMPATANGAWIYPTVLNGQNVALVAWWSGALRSVSYIVLPSGADRAKSLREQLAQLAWAGELEGWLTTLPEWHLVAEGGLAAEWETYLHEGLGEGVQLSAPLARPELAAHTARRVIASEGKHAVLLPAEFSTRYREQLFDRLWLHGLLATGMLYAVCVAIYFCATFFLGIQTRKVEQQVAGLGASYTNVLQLKARYLVLKERQDLKYAALDCWKLVANLLPEDISLQRFSFGDGRKLALNGTVSSDEITLITDFYDSLRKARLNGQEMFNAEGGDQLTYHGNGNQATWGFSLELRRTEEKGP